MGNMMSLNISDEVIKAAVQEEVHAGIVKALGDPSVIVRDAIKTMTNRYVNKDGKFCERGSWNAKPYFDWLAEDIVKTTVKEEIEKYAKKAFESLHCLGVVRFDFLYNAKSKKLYLNEINSIPGSLAYYLFESKGMSFYELITQLIDIAEYRREKNKNRVHIYQGSHLTQIMHKK